MIRDTEQSQSFGANYTRSDSSIPDLHLTAVRRGRVEQVMAYCITTPPLSATGMLRLDGANRILCACASRIHRIERLPEAAVCTGEGRTEADGR